MIIKRSIIVPVLILMLLFTSVFVSLNSMFLMPQEIMGSGNVYVLTSSQDKNPLRSNLDLNLAYGLENTSYITSVSPEIFLFTTIKNQPVTLRGVIFSNFLNMEGGKIIRGKIPTNLTGALAGEKIFKFLHLKIGEKLTIYGSFQSSLAVITITGVFETGGSADDEILVSLPTAQKLAGIGDNQVSIIRFKTLDVERAKELLSPTYPKFTVNITSPPQVYTFDRFNVTVNIMNMGTKSGLCNLRVNFENESFVKDIYVQKNTTFNITFRAYVPGNQKIVATVENTVLTYSVSNETLVVKNPVTMRGKILTYVNFPTYYRFLSMGKGINNATLIVSGKNYSRTYHFNYSLNITFPHAGDYNLSFEKYGYENRTFLVKVFRRAKLSSLMQITPNPVENVIFLKKGNALHFNFTNETKIYYSIDGGLIKSVDGNISLGSSVYGNHVIDLNVVKGWEMGNATFIIHIYNNTGIFTYVPFNNNIPVYYNATYNISIWSELPFEYVLIRLNNHTEYLNHTYSFIPTMFNYTINVPLRINESKVLVDIFARNVINDTLHLVLAPKVIHSKDTEKPSIVIGNPGRSFSSISPQNYLTIWSGESVVLRAYDNLKIVNFTVSLFGHTYYSSQRNPGYISIPTMQMESETVYYMPQGTYNGTAKAIDAAGNVNVTDFEVIINNTDEKMAPVVFGSSVLNFDKSNEYTFRIFDNTKIRSIYLYVNGSDILHISNLNVSNFTLTINSSEIPEGLNKGNLLVYDIWGNLRDKSLLILRNYTDTEPPTIHIVKMKIWSGENIVVKTEDNVKVKKTSVYIFGKWYNGSSVVSIPTMEVLNNSVYFVSPGNYPIKIYTQDIFNNLNHTEGNITIDNSDEKIPPVIFLPSIEICNATDILNFTAFDNVGVKLIKIVEGNKTMAISYSDNLSVEAKVLGYGFVSAEVYAEDVNNNIISQQYNVFIIDNIPPQIENTHIEMWGGNTTNITIRDDTGIKFGCLRIFGKVFRNFGNRIEIKTMFISNSSVYFIPSGKYIGRLMVGDYSGNINVTNVTVIINNTGEKLPPIIIGNTYGVISNNRTVVFHAYDNVGVDKMWWVWGDKIVGNSPNDTLIINFTQLPIGTHNITIYAKDINGNVAHMNVTLDVVGISNVTIKLSVERSKITVNQQAIVTIQVLNGINEGEYSKIVYLDNSPYMKISLNLTPYEIKVITIKLPYLSEGDHIIRVGKETIKLKITAPPIEKLPLDLLLKYDKNLQITGGKNVIYKGFQMSEGNFIILIYSLVIIGIVLVVLGMYSSILKALSSRNIAILRAIGATNRQIIGFAIKDSIYLILIPILAGVMGGYFSLMVLEKMELLRAFGHRLIISTSSSIITLNVLIGVAFSIFVIGVVLRDVLSSKVIHLFTDEQYERETNLKEVLQ